MPLNIKEQRAGGREHGAGSRGQGAGSREQGAGSWELGAWCRELGVIIEENAHCSTLNVNAQHSTKKALRKSAF
jgi:hypothetical protein